jgi:hypothetical protein
MTLNDVLGLGKLSKEIFKFLGFIPEGIKGLMEARLRIWEQEKKIF